MKSFIIISVLLLMGLVNLVVVSCTRENADPCRSQLLIDSLEVLKPYGGLANGRIKVTVFPDSAVVLKLNDGKDTTGRSFTGLKAGKYTITATGPGGCKSIREVTLEEGDGCSQQKFEINIDTVISAYYGGRGTIRASVRGDNTGLVMSLLSGSPGNFKAVDSNKTVYPSLAGNSKWFIAARNKYGCTDTTDEIIITSVECPITSPMVLSVKTTITTICTPSGTVNFGVTGTNIVAPFTYALVRSLSATRAFSKTTSYSGLAAGKYYVIAKDGNGCSSAAKEFDILPETRGKYFNSVAITLNSSTCSRSSCHGSSTKFANFSQTCTILDKAKTIYTTVFIPTKAHPSISNLTALQKEQISTWFRTGGGKYTY